MNPNDVAPMVVGVTFFIITGLVILLRPISKKLGAYLEVLAEERRRSLSEQPVSRVESERIVQVLEGLDNRLARLDERQEFTDRLLVDRPRAALKD
jgi:hypothetical protein